MCESCFQMQPILDKIINLVQSLSKRSVYDNILITYEIMIKFKNMKGEKSSAGAPTFNM